ncbi:hypothetical protein JNK13_07880 [bacterium]|nr:hypothetical protein [bacterium]
MRTIENDYNEALDKLGPIWRVERTCKLYDAIREMLAIQIQTMNPGLSLKELKGKIAERMYMSDIETLKLIQLADK